MLTNAVSPLCMYSSESASAALTQPVPVVVATPISLRLRPPMRSSSSAANWAVARIPLAEFTPA